MRTFDCRIIGTCKVNAENEEEARSIAEQKSEAYWDWENLEVEEE